ncbi:MAG TPA: glutathione S-transferase family protein, partial [Alphaproteobacteria bacterium]|nr:glutathione S-transferase family protein [Alphaproteobacteria bacterium]
MTLALYHAEPGANSLKVLIGFKEKKIPFVSHYVNLHKFEQHENWFKKINPNGQVPALVHDGKVITESSVINEYLDDVFPEKPLRPADPYWRARMRIWTKYMDEYAQPSVSHIAWHQMIHTITDELTPEEFEARLAKIPLKEQQEKWRRAAKQSFTKEELDEWRRKIETAALRLEAQLAQTPYCAGASFSLADVNCYIFAGGAMRMRGD